MYIQVIPTTTVVNRADTFGGSHPMAGYEAIAEGFTSGNVVMEIWVEEGEEIPEGFRRVN